MINLFIDSNIFLSFYQFASDDLVELEKLVELIKAKKIRLLLPAQVRMEVQRRREGVLSTMVSTLGKQTLQFQFPNICKSYPEHEALRDLQKSYSKSHSLLIAKLNADVAKRTLGADKLIKELFALGIAIPLSVDILEAARVRRDVGNPPGKNGSLGDAINWESLLCKAPDGEDLNLVGADNDFSSPLDNGKLREFLLIEWDERKSKGFPSRIWYYRKLSAFFSHEFPHIKLASEVGKDILIEKLAASGSFQQTHSVIASLNSYPDFNSDQRNSILAAAAMNNQILWIAGDPDVKAFLQKIIAAHDATQCAEHIEALEGQMYWEEPLPSDS